MKKPKRKRTLPHNIAEKTDAEIMERIFGKRAKRELDKIAKDSKPVARKGFSGHLTP